MKTLVDVIAELNALDTTELSSLTAAIATAVTDLQAISDAAGTVAAPVEDPVAIVVVTTKAGVVTTLTAPVASV